jgi:hypothetical protein
MDDTNRSIPAETDWSSTSALDDLVLERTVNADADEIALAKRIARESTPLIMHRLCHTAIHDPNPTARVSAAREVLARTMGKPGEDSITGAPLEEMLKDFIDKTEEFANS